MERRIPLRSLAFAVALSLVVSGIVLVGYDAHGALITLAIVGPLGVLTVLAGELIAARRPGGLRQQFGAVALLGVISLAIVVALFVDLMFVSSHDAVMTILLAAYAGALVLWIARRLGNLTLAAVCAADAVLTVFTSDPGSALGAARVSAFVDLHRDFENTSAQLIGVACSLWDREGRAAREVVGALEGTDLPLLETRIPLSRRVPSATLAKRPVVLGAPTSAVAQAYAALTDEVLASYARLVPGAAS